MQSTMLVIIHAHHERHKHFPFKALPSVFACFVFPVVTHLLFCQRISDSSLRSPLPHLCHCLIILIWNNSVVSASTLRWMHCPISKSCIVLTLVAKIERKIVYMFCFHHLLKTNDCDKSTIEAKFRRSLTLFLKLPLLSFMYTFYPSHEDFLFFIVIFIRFSSCFIC